MDNHSVCGTARHNDDTGLRDVMASTILPEIVANTHSIWYCDVLVDDGAANPASPPDDAIVENDRVFDDAPTLDMDTSPEYRTANYAPRENASATDDRTYGLTRAARLIESKFRSWVRIAGRSYRPPAIIEIEGR